MVRIFLNNSLGLTLVVATLSLVATCNPVSNSPANFDFFKNSYYNDKIRSISPRPNKCYTVGEFASAAFYGPALDVVKMFTEPHCRGIMKERVISVSGAPGDNIKDYGKLFSSFIYKPKNNHSHHHCGSTCNPVSNSPANFDFFKNSYYNDKIRSISPRPNKCYTVGEFASAAFYGPALDVVKMFTEPHCRGIMKERVISVSGAPGDNIKDYGKLFSSFIYKPKNNHSHHHCGCNGHQY
ncbi:hypothetical protein AYI69_g219 [Smittium culicis]|uniref:Uncharacterized protein n=1 Tax=Smittium culicis TaxID=133412 RepID=A0A1R1YTZ2_9FUNG|nr:hypothetical protein AYI69_g219 [Smittium culicis]